MRQEPRGVLGCSDQATVVDPPGVIACCPMPVDTPELFAGCRKLDASEAEGATDDLLDKGGQVLSRSCLDPLPRQQ